MSWPYRKSFGPGKRRVHFFNTNAESPGGGKGEYKSSPLADHLICSGHHEINLTNTTP
jgi:hypothetical protein